MEEALIPYGVPYDSRAMEQEHVGNFIEGTPFDVLFGTPARAKILGVLVAERGRDLSKSEIARQAGIARSTVYDHLDDLERLGVVTHTRTSGASERYELNENSDVADLLDKLEGVTLQALLDLDEADRFELQGITNH